MCTRRATVLFIVVILMKINSTRFGVHFDHASCWIRTIARLRSSFAGFAFMHRANITFFPASLSKAFIRGMGYRREYSFFMQFFFAVFVAQFIVLYFFFVRSFISFDGGKSMLNDLILHAMHRCRYRMWWTCGDRLTIMAILLVHVIDGFSTGFPHLDPSWSTQLNSNRIVQRICIQ